MLLQWEDFARDNATRLLQRYRDRLCTFNDDIQGTAAVTTGTLLAAVNVTGVPLTEHRIAVLGGGSAGIGICSLLLKAMLARWLARSRSKIAFLCGRSRGTAGRRHAGVVEFQAPFVQSRAAWRIGSLIAPERIEPYDVVRNAHPTVLVGVSGQPGGFPERVVRAMARGHAAAHYLSALQSHLARRGTPQRCSGLDARPRGHRHRQPVPTGAQRRDRLSRRSDQQCLRLSGHRTGQHSGRGAPYQRWHAYGGCARPGGSLPEQARP